MVPQTHLQEAVSLALEIDMQLATSYAVRPQEDEALQRKLWLAIACHVIQRASLSAGEDGAVSLWRSLYDRRVLYLLTLYTYLSNPAQVPSHSTFLVE